MRRAPEGLAALVDAPGCANASGQRGPRRATCCASARAKWTAGSKSVRSGLNLTDVHTGWTELWGRRSATWPGAHITAKTYGSEFYAMSFDEKRQTLGLLGFNGGEVRQLPSR